MARKKSEGATTGAVPPASAEDAPGETAGGAAAAETLSGAGPVAPAAERAAGPDESEAAAPIEHAPAGPVAPTPEGEAAPRDLSDPLADAGLAPAEPGAGAAEPAPGEGMGEAAADPALGRPWQEEPGPADVAPIGAPPAEEELRAEEPGPADAAPVESILAAPAAEERRAEEPRPAVAEVAVEEEFHEEGWSFAARALTALLLLLVGAGLGIWAAPRIAPLLPSGMSGAAAWLTPGSREAEAQVAALQGEVEGLKGQIAALPDAAAVETQAKGAVDALRGELAGQIDGLREELSRSAAGDVGDRVGRLETAMAGATTEFAALKQQIETRASGLSAEAAQGLDTYRAELQGLKAEVGRLSGSVSGLGTRFDEASAAAEARASEAEQQAAAVQETATAARDRAATLADIAAIRAALASGEPFQTAIDRLAASGVAVPQGLAGAAADGVETPAELRAAFGPAAHAAIRASIEAGSGDGVVARARAFLDAQLASRSLAPREGMDPDAVLSRVEDALKRDDLAAALAQAGQLPSESKAALAGWIAAAQQRAGATAGLAELEAGAPATN